MKGRMVWVLAALLASLGVLAVACGDDEGGGGGDATPTVASTATPSPAVSALELFDCAKAYPGTEPDASNFPLRLADDGGRQVDFAAPPSKIVSLSAASVEVLYAIGAGGHQLFRRVMADEGDGDAFHTSGLRGFHAGDSVFENDATRR